MIGFAPGLRLKRKEEVMNTKTFKKALTTGSLLMTFAGLASGQEHASPAPSNALSVRYLIQDLGVVGPVEGQPFVITANGYVAGLAVVPNGVGNVAHAVYWHGTSMKDISSPGLGGTNSAAMGVRLWVKRRTPRLIQMARTFAAFNCWGIPAKRIPACRMSIRMAR